MLTPQDILDIKFQKSMNGYNKDQVEDFLDKVHVDYSALYKENVTLKGKMRVLVDKIEEYRSVDEQMRKAFYAAQVASNETITKAQTEADMILSNARQEAESNLKDIRLRIEAEEKRLEVVKAECVKYAESMKEMLGRNIEFIDILMEKSAPQILVEDSQKMINERVEAFELDSDVIAAGNDEQKETETAAESIGDTKEMTDISEISEASTSEPKAEKPENREPEPREAAAAKTTVFNPLGKDMDDSGRIIVSEGLKFGKSYKEDDDD